jgi:hypothetical protein
MQQKNAAPVRSDAAFFIGSGLSLPRALRRA